MAPIFTNINNLNIRVSLHLAFSSACFFQLLDLRPFLSSQASQALLTEDESPLKYADCLAGVSLLYFPRLALIGLCGVAPQPSIRGPRDFALHTTHNTQQSRKGELRDKLKSLFSHPASPLSGAHSGS